MKYEYIDILKFDFGKYIKFLIWHNDDKGNDIVEIRNNRILMFDNIENAERFVNSDNCDCWEYDIPKLENWIDTHDRNFDCRFLLDFWNIFNDIVYSFGEKIPGERSRKADRVYNKLFFGNNLPAITPEGKHFIPVFTKTDRKTTRKILSYGLDFLEKHI